EQFHPPAVGRREGAHRHRARLRALPAQPGALLPARRGRCAARRAEYRAVCGNRPSHVGPDAVPVHYPQQDRDGAGIAPDRGDHAGAGGVAHRRGRSRPGSRVRRGGLAARRSPFVSSLGLSLLILALVGVGGVLLYNYWLGGFSIRRRVPDSREPEPLLRQEPRFGRVGPGAIEPGPGEGVATPGEDEPPVLDPEVAEPGSPAPAPAGASSPSAPAPAAHSPAPEGAVISAQDRILEAQAARAGPPAPRLHPLVDCCVAIELPGPVASDRIIALARRFRRAGSKPVLIEGSALPNVPAVPAGVREDDAQPTDPAGRGDAPDDRAPVDPAAAAGAAAEAAVDVDARAESRPQADAGTAAATVAAEDPWESPVPGRQYRSLRVGILLANRHGPLNAMEYSEFVNGLQSLADSLGGFVDPPDMMKVLERARELDARCAALDAQIGVNVEVAEALSPADLSGIAQSADV